jgi:hypothetical protein
MAYISHGIAVVGDCHGGLAISVNGTWSARLDVEIKKHVFELFDLLDADRRSDIFGRTRGVNDHCLSKRAPQYW